MVHRADRNAVMASLDVPAFLPCGRRYGLGRPGFSTATIPPRVTLTPSTTFQTPFFSTDRMSFSSLNVSGRESHNRMSSTSTRKTTMSSISAKPSEELPPTPAAKRPIFLALLCSVSVLFGTPDFDYIAMNSDATIMNSKALALEKSSNSDPSLESSSSTWSPSSSSLSDRLFKSMSAREITRDSNSSPTRNKQRYWDLMKGSSDDISFANEKLIDHAVATVSTMYYDSSGGFNFDSQEFYANWKKFRYSTLHPREVSSGSKEKNNINEFESLDKNGFATRGNAVKTLKSTISQLNDPYSKYLTREELRAELKGGSDGFLGLGALVDSSSPSSSTLAFDTKKPIRPSSTSSTKEFDRISNRPVQGGVSLESSTSLTEQFAIPFSGGTSASASGIHGKINSKKGILSVAQAENLPVITAIIPDSPAERAGLVVGDRIASVGDYQFTGMSRSHVEKALRQKFHADNYFGRADLTVAKRVMTPPALDNENTRYDADGNIVEEKYVFEDGWYRPKNNRQSRLDSMMLSEQVLGYKLSHMKSIPTTITAKLDSSVPPASAASPELIQSKFPSVVGGDPIVHFELLTPDDSIFQHMAKPGESRAVGYIRLTRFSRSSSDGFIDAIKSLEEAGAQSYIIDLRNNYGGVIQEAMLTASTLLRDPHSVLCYTLNSRGGFKPQENMEYIVDPKYPGYLLSSESSTVARDQVRREHPEYLEDGGWSSPTSYASLKELRMTRGIKPAHFAPSSYGGAKAEDLERPTALLDNKDTDLEKLADVMTWNSQKKLVILINEGTGKSHCGLKLRLSDALYLY